MKTKELARRRRRAHQGAHTQRADPAAATAAAADANAAAEHELKFEVPEASWPGLLQVMSAPGTQQVPMHAVYYDTPEGALAAAGIAVRVRREGDRWVQTLKARGDGPFHRLEDNVPLGPVQGGRAAPKADLARHVGKAVRDALDRALGEARDAVVLVAACEVEVTRRLKRVVHGTSQVEVALDEGRISAAGRMRPVRELELELVEGRFEDLLQLARRWREGHELWLAVASKAERAQRLALGELHAPATGAQRPVLGPRPTLGEFTSAVLAECLRQVLANAGEVAAGSQADDHVHQLRVGLRRLRSALRDLPPLAQVRERTEPALVATFRALGERRDRTHVLHRIQPLVEAAGGPDVRLPAGFLEGSDPGVKVRDGAFQDALMALLLRAESVRLEDDAKVRATLRPVLARLHKQVTRAGRRFTRLSEEDQHGVRKRLKRLRYLAEFVAPLYRDKPVTRFLAALKPAQDALGDYNDELMARGLYEQLVGTDPGARFGVEWLAGRRKGRARDCRAALRKMGKTRPFWER